MSKKVEKLVPELRFSEFQDDWEKYSLSDLIRLKSGYAFSSNFFSNEETDKILLTPGNFHIDGSLYFGSNTKYYKGEVNQEYILSNGDLLIVMTDLTKEMNILGNSIILQSEKTVIHNQRIGKVLIKDNLLINFIFLRYILNSDVCKLEIRRKATGSTVRHTSNKSILSIAVSIPSLLKEQKKITSFLDAIALRITQLRRKHELLESYKKGVMQRIFSQQIRFKQDDAKAFPDWEKKKLGEVASFSKGKGITKENLVKSGQLKCIRYAELYTLYDEVINDVISSTNLDPNNLVLSIENDVIIPSSGETSTDIARAACVKISGVALGGDLNILRTKIDGCFLAHYLNHYKKNEIAKIAQGNTVVHLYNSQLKIISIKIPIQKEQEKIVNFLTSIDEKIKAVALQIEKLEEFKKGLLQKMFV